MVRADSVPGSARAGEVADWAWLLLSERTTPASVEKCRQNEAVGNGRQEGVSLPFAASV